MRRLIVYGSIIALAWGFYVWQPYEYDFIPRAIPKDHPPVDPDSKILFSPAARVLVVTAHPDDEEFYIGGTMLKLAAAGADLRLVVCTDGDKGYYPFEDYQRNRRVRRQEQIEAAAAYREKEVIFFGHPDGRLRVSEALVQHLVEEIQRIRPNYVLAFDSDYPPRMSHQDHRRSGEATLLAVRRAGVPLWLLRFSTIAPNYVVDITDQWDEKARLLAIHKSQFYGKHLEQVTNMVESNAMEDGDRIGATYGEGFDCLRAPGGP